jgi:hypothetical protein
VNCKEYILKICTFLDIELSVPVKTALSNNLEGRFLDSFKGTNGIKLGSRWLSVSFFHF